MILWNEVLDEFSLKDGGSVRGIGLGSEGPGQSCFIIPVKAHRDETIDPRRWGVRETMTGKPQIVSNLDDTPGVLARLTTFNRVGHRLGRIYAVAVDPLSDILVLGYGLGGSEDNRMRYEEAVVRVIGRAVFYLQNVGPPDSLITIEGEEVSVEPLAPEQVEGAIGGELVRIDEPRLPRWKRPVRP